MCTLSGPARMASLQRRDDAGEGQSQPRLHELPAPHLRTRGSSDELRPLLTTTSSRFLSPPVCLVALRSRTRRQSRRRHSPGRQRRPAFFKCFLGLLFSHGLGSLLFDGWCPCVAAFFVFVSCWFTTAQEEDVADSKPALADGKFATAEACFVWGIFFVLFFQSRFTTPPLCCPS